MYFHINRMKGGDLFDLIVASKGTRTYETAKPYMKELASCVHVSHQDY